MNADRIAAAIALVATLLSATGLPSKLGLTPQWVTAIGGLVLACAGIIRGLLQHHDGVRVDWRDLLGAALGVIAIGLGLDGAAVDQIDPDMLAGGASFAAMVFAAQRGVASLPGAEP